MGGKRRGREDTERKTRKRKKSTPFGLKFAYHSINRLIWDCLLLCAIFSVKAKTIAALLSSYAHN